MANSETPRPLRACLWLLFAGSCLAVAGNAPAGELQAGVARVDITHPTALPIHDPLYVKALFLKGETAALVLVTIDAVAIGEIGTIRNDFLARVRTQLEKDLGLNPAHVLVNASHCHGVVCEDVEQRTLEAVKEAARALVPVRVGTGVGREDRVMENRRLRMKDGREIDVRRAYSLPPDAQVEGVGPVDPEIGILRIDRKDGRPLAIVYNFACHPIQGVAAGGNTADMTGFASRVIEEGLDGATALFVQGCAGDINPARYKDVSSPPNAEALGNLLGLSALKGAKRAAMRESADLTLVSESIELPRADFAGRIESLESEQSRLLKSLRGTTLDLKTFLPLAVKYNLGGDFPSDSAYRYLHEKGTGRGELARLDDENRRNLAAYVQNILTMEELTRVQTNLALLRKHQAQNVAAGKRTLDVELAAVRVGDFVLTTFPGELTVQIGLNIKRASPHRRTFVAGYTNGYIYYAPTASQLRNLGAAQEDCDTLLAPEWQEIYEARAAEMLKKLQVGSHNP